MCAATTLDSVPLLPSARGTSRLSTETCSLGWSIYPCKTWRASCCSHCSWCPCTLELLGVRNTQWIVPIPVTATRARAPCAARELCWTTVAAAECVQLLWGRLAIVQSRGWMVSSVALGWSASFTLRRMTLVMNLVSAKVMIFTLYATSVAIWQQPICRVCLLLERSKMGFFSAHPLVKKKRGKYLLSLEGVPCSGTCLLMWQYCLHLGMCVTKYRQGVLGDEISNWGLGDPGTSPVLSVALVGGFL